MHKYEVGQGGAYGMSEGVTGSDGGGGRLIRVDALDMAAVECLR